MTAMPVELRLAVTVVFLATGVFCLRRCVSLARSPRVADRVGYGAHALMSGSMVAMVWSAPRLVGWQMALFAVACGWFVVQALGLPVGSLRLASAPAGVAPIAAVGHGGHSSGGRARCLHHAVVMAAMVWMFAAMSPGSMSMPGMTPMAMRARHPGASTLLIATTGGVYCLAAAVLLLLLCVVAGVRRRRGADKSVRDDVAHALMTAGMGAMLFAVA